MLEENLELENSSKEEEEIIVTPPTICTLTLADGTTIENLRLNGTNYVSETKLDETIFTRENLITLIVIDNENNSHTLNNAELIQQVHYDDGWYICFREISQQEIEDQQRKARLEALEEAMLTMLLSQQQEEEMNV